MIFLSGRNSMCQKEDGPYRQGGDEEKVSKDDELV